MSNRQSTWAVFCLTAGLFALALAITLAIATAASQPRTVHTDTTIRSIP
jgi:hypothetical protein